MLLPLPPGPPGDPILGHVRIVPYENPQIRYVEWGEQYNSDILYFNMLGRPVVVLNSVEAAEELLDKRGANYQDRPRFVMFEVMGWGITLTSFRDGPKFKLHRKLIQNTFTHAACKNYRDLQTEEMRKAVKDIVSDQKDWERRIRKHSTAIVLRIGFGVRIHNDDDPFIQMADDANFATTQGGTPASTIGDFFPAITYLPNWLARSAPLRHAREWGFAVRRIHDECWSVSTKQILSGNVDPSFMKTHLETYWKAIEQGTHQSLSDPTTLDIQGAAGAIFIAGSNTTWSTILICILHLLLTPSVKQKAQAEIDALLSSSPSPRLPTFSDTSKLPYLNNLVQETFRIAPLSPVGIPHKSLADDTYNGYSIPAGSIVYANARAMCYDPRVYRDPEIFDPDRYARGEPYPKGPFGFGRRACPGKYLAQASVFIFLATLLAVCDVECPRDERGEEIRLKGLGLSNGLSSHPDKFECVFKVRRRDRLELLQRAVD